MISHKENEKRRALVPLHLKLNKYLECIHIEDGYGETLGYLNESYKRYVINIR